MSEFELCSETETDIIVSSNLPNMSECELCSETETDIIESSNLPNMSECELCSETETDIIVSSNQANMPECELCSETKTDIIVDPVDHIDPIPSDFNSFLDSLEIDENTNILILLAPAEKPQHFAVNILDKNNSISLHMSLINECELKNLRASKLYEISEVVEPMFSQNAIKKWSYNSNYKD